MVYGLFRALPGDRAFLPPSLSGIASANLMPASGHQDHTASPSASSAFVKAPRASTASRLTSVTIAKRPLRKGGTGGGCKVIWVKPEQISFCKQDWTGRISLNCFNKFYFARTRLSVSASKAAKDRTLYRIIVGEFPQ
jgi:hypothetical protein